MTRPRPVFIHPHLFGSLFATKAGQSFLQSQIDLTELCAIIIDEEESTLNRRAVLWAVAHIACQENGYDYLLVCSVIFANNNNNNE